MMLLRDPALQFSQARAKTVLRKVKMQSNLQRIHSLKSPYTEFCVKGHKKTMA